MTIPVRLVFWDATDVSVDLDIKYSTLIVDLILDFISLFDIYLRMFKFVAFSKNVLIDNPAQVTALYINKWLFIDVLASFPLPSCYRLLTNDYGAVSTYMDAIKFLRYLRINTYVRDIEHFLTSKKIFISAAISRMIKNIFLLVIFSVSMAMVFYVVSDNSGPVNWRNTYLVSDSGRHFILCTLL